jgi:hypothetical protein
VLDDVVVDRAEVVVDEAATVAGVTASCIVGFVAVADVQLVTAIEIAATPFSSRMVRAIVPLFPHP